MSEAPSKENPLLRDTRSGSSSSDAANKKAAEEIAALKEQNATLLAEKSELETRCEELLSSGEASARTILIQRSALKELEKRKEPSDQLFKSQQLAAQRAGRIQALEAENRGLCQKVAALKSQLRRAETTTAR